jgi:hypothetical protein
MTEHEHIDLLEQRARDVAAFKGTKVGSEPGVVLELIEAWRKVNDIKGQPDAAGLLHDTPGPTSGPAVPGNSQRIPRNKVAGDDRRVGAVKTRSQVKNPITGTWTKRDDSSGKFMDVKADPKPFKGVRKTKGQ